MKEWVLLTKIYLFRIYNQLLDSNPNSSIIKIDEEIQKQAQNNESEQQKQQQSLPQPQQSSKNDKVGPMIIFLFGFFFLIFSMEYVSEIGIFGLKMMVKSGLDFFFWNSSMPKAFFGRAICSTKTDGPKSLLWKLKPYVSELLWFLKWYFFDANFQIVILNHGISYWDRSKECGTDFMSKQTNESTIVLSIITERMTFHVIM